MPQFSFGMSSVITRGIIRCKYFQHVRWNGLISHQFHTSQFVSVRGVAGKKHSTNVKVNSESENLRGPEDVFGIESDDGVIYVAEKTRSTVNESNEPNNSSTSDKEHLFSTSFGHLRFDSHNRPKIHGQFDANIAQSEFSYGINVQKEKRQRTQKARGIPLLDFYMASVRKKEVTEGLGRKIDDVCEKAAVGNTDTCGNKNAEANSIVDQPNEDFGFIDSTYFHDSVDTIGNSEGCEDLNLLKNNIQRNEVKNGNFEFSPDHLCDQSKSGSYIDCIYFEGSYENDNVSVQPNRVDQKTEASSVKTQPGDYVDASSELKNENLCKESSFIDSLYFGSIVEGKPASHGKNTFTLQDSGEPGDFSTSKVSDSDIFNNSELGNSHKDTRHDSTDFLGINQETEKNLAFPPQQSQMQTTSQNAVDLSHDPPEGLKLIKQLEKELHTGETKTGPLVSAEKDQVRTAYEYVLKLRRTDVKPDTETGMKLDSKGFRILKNQVPDLSHLTRSELTNLLKERVLFCNDDIVILNKPYNLIIHESKTTKEPTLSSVLDDLACKLDKSAGQPQLFTVHRLDKETTGCLLLARNELAAQKLKALFAQRQIEKHYLVVTTRVPDPTEGVIDIPIAEGKIENRVRMVLQPDIPKEIKYKTHVKNGKRAITYYKVVATSENAALLDVSPETGLKHQIRVHLGFGLNCPVLGDHKYSHLTKLAPQRLSGDILRKLEIRQSKVRYVPMHIHARTVRIPNYLGGRDLFVSAPLPEHIKHTLKCLKFRDI